MPRRSKDEVNHDKVVPLSLPEVQIAVANSISRDRIDEDAAIRAVQGYELLVQGSLKNNLAETTKKITGHGGYYRNMMRGVAQVFGIRKLPQDTDQVVMNASSSEEDGKNNDDGSDELFEPPLKKTRTVHRAELAVPESTQQAPASKPRRDEENSGESDTDNEVVEDTADREEPMDAQLAPSSIEENPIPQPVLTASTPADGTPTVPLAKTPFNRYKRSSKRAISKERGDDISTTQKMGNSVIETEECSGTKGILEDTEKGGNVDGSGSRGVQIEEDNSLVGVKSGTELGTVETKPLGPAGEEQQPSPKQEHAKQDELDAPDEGTEQNYTARELSEPEADPSSPQGRRASLHELYSEDFSILAREIAEKENLTFFAEQESIQTIETSILPGTWMFNHKKLSTRKFLSPEKSDAYLMIREVTEDMPSVDIASLPKPARQIILYRNLKEICSLVDSPDPIEAVTISYPISVLLFDNKDLDIDEKVICGIHNVFNGLLRAYAQKKYTHKSTQKKKIANIKNIIESVTSKVVQVAMPKPVISSMNTAYTLTNLHYLSRERNIDDILSKAASSDSTTKLEVKVQKGNRKVSISTTVISVDASNVYDHSYVEPILAL